MNRLPEVNGWDPYVERNGVAELRLGKKSRV